MLKKNKAQIWGGCVNLENPFSLLCKLAGKLKVLVFVLVIAGCSHTALLPETKATLEEANQMIAEGKRLVKEAEQKKVEAKRFKKRGEELIQRGKRLKRSVKTLEDAERLRQKGEQEKAKISAP